ncbi:MAG TPA: hypothetical protein VKB76_17885, partial [Ktedonobacterales bacterium]|nr:hypothetical protein [Ktedonobacterales bacterium]
GGLTRVEQREIIFPMGRFGGRVGIMSATDCLAVGKAMRGAVTSANIMSGDAYDRLYQATEREFQQPTSQSLLPFYVAYGQKPAY